MTSLFDIRFALLIMGFFVWIYRALRALRAVRRAPTIRPANQRPEGKVSVIIPARNEENNIAACVDGLLNQTHGDLEIIVANDGSADQTESILKSYGDRIRFFTVPPTPKGWTGKNFAIHTAIRHASGDWFLFTDADTRHAPESVASSFSYAQANDIRFLTLLPQCLTNGFWEHLLQPLAMGYIGLWFPIEKINTAESSVYFANGQYILMDRALYESIGGHEEVKGAFLEDFAMMEIAKTEGCRTECAFGTEVFGTRMYDSFSGIWRGWRRIYLHAFKRNPIDLFGRFLAMLLFSVFPFIAFFLLLPAALTHPAANMLLLGGLATLLVLIIATSWKTYTIMKANRRYVLLHPVGGFFLAMILLNACWMAILAKETDWR